MNTLPGFDTLEDARVVQDELRRQIAENNSALAWAPSIGATGGGAAGQRVTGVSIGISRFDTNRYRLVVRNRRREAAKAVRAAIKTFLPGLIDYKQVSRPTLLSGGVMPSRVLGLGASVSHFLDAGASGSAGFFAKDSRTADRICLVSNAHVLKHRNWEVAGIPAGAPHHTLQPSRGHGGQHPQHRVGQLHDSAPLNYQQLNWIDAAVSVTDTDLLPRRPLSRFNRFTGNVPPALRAAGQIHSFHDAPHLLLQSADQSVSWGASMAVHKHGARTGWTTGVVTAVEMDFDVPVRGQVYHFKHALEVTGIGQNFADLGDSGAAVVDNDGAVVGLVFAVQTLRQSGSATAQTPAYVIPIETVRIYFGYLTLT